MSNQHERSNPGSRSDLAVEHVRWNHTQSEFDIAHRVGWWTVASTRAFNGRGKIGDGTPGMSRATSDAIRIIFSWAPARGRLAS